MEISICNMTLRMHFHPRQLLTLDNNNNACRQRIDKYSWVIWQQGSAEPRNTYRGGNEKWIFFHWHFQLHNNNNDNLFNLIWLKMRTFFVYMSEKWIKSPATALLYCFKNADFDPAPPHGAEPCVSEQDSIIINTHIDFPSHRPADIIHYNTLSIHIPHTYRTCPTGQPAFNIVSHLGLNA